MAILGNRIIRSLKYIRSASILLVVLRGCWPERAKMPAPELAWRKQEFFVRCRSNLAEEVIYNLRILLGSNISRSFLAKERTEFVATSHLSVNE